MSILVLYIIFQHVLLHVELE